MSPYRWTRWVGGLGALILLVSGCGASPSAERSTDAASDRSSDSSSAPASRSALDDPRHPDHPTPLIDPADLVSGGPPPDGIPPIDEPRFAPAGEVDWLEDGDPVLSLTVGSETRAYPLQVMTWHEIVNDTVGDLPGTVTYCPLCNSGVAFERRADGRLLDFGTSGMPYVDNLVMYDRQTETLWPQLTGLASIGELTGVQLTAIPMGVVGWRQFREAHPDALVLTRETGHTRDYGRNPYVGYDEPDGDLLVEPPGGRDGRLPVKERVVGITVGEQSVAVLRRRVVKERVVPVTVDGRRLVIWHQPGQASALDTDRIREGRDVGTVVVLDPTLRDGRRLTFTARGQAFVDDRTGSTWDVFGRATAGPLRGARLEQVVHLDTFWFAWVGFRPETTLVE